MSGKVTRLVGDVIDQMSAIPDGSVSLVATSVPFWKLRDYGVEGQWGQEPDPAAFLDRLLAFTDEARRVLAPWGSLVVELGDTYLSQKIQPPDGRWPRNKSLAGLPGVFAASLAHGRNLLTPPEQHLAEVAALVAAGTPADQAVAAVAGRSERPRWLVRNQIVWARPNPTPNTLGDKVRNATTYLTVATDARDRWCDLDAVRTPHKARPQRRFAAADYQAPGAPAVRTRQQRDTPGVDGNPLGAPPTDYWDDPYSPEDLVWIHGTQGTSLPHFAVWPPALVDRIITSMCPERVCGTCGQPSRRIKIPTGRPRPGGASRARNPFQGRSQAGIPHPAYPEPATIDAGWSDCEHDNWERGVVLDPFSGTGTTLAAAVLRGRDAIGIDLSSIHQDLYDRRFDEVKRALFDIRPEPAAQQALFDPAGSPEPDARGRTVDAGASR